MRLSNRTFTHTNPRLHLGFFCIQFQICEEENYMANSNSQVRTESKQRTFPIRYEQRFDRLKKGITYDFTHEKGQ